MILYNLKKIFKIFKIKLICVYYNIRHYTINDDLSIDVKGDVNLSNKRLSKLPLTFDIVHGNFFCNNNNLTSLEGSPSKCIGFYCYRNYLNSLDGSPDYCYIIDCSVNPLLFSLNSSPICDFIICDLSNIVLDNESIYVVKSLSNYYSYLESYYKVRYRDYILNNILNNY